MIYADRVLITEIMKERDSRRERTMLLVQTAELYPNICCHGNRVVFKRWRCSRNWPVIQYTTNQLV